MRSSLYEGVVEHVRYAPRAHTFRYRLFLLYVDLDELPALFAESRLWSLERFNLGSLRRRDYLGDPDVPLAEAVRARVADELGRRPEGPIRMLTHCRLAGYVFNPVTFYYCFEPGRSEPGTEGLDAVVAEITNTPWRERHAYVLDARLGEEGAGRSRTWTFPKTFHVSPFFDMDHEYAWTFATPGRELSVQMQNRTGGTRVFDVRLQLERRAWSPAELRRALWRHPLLTWRVHLAIYWQALRLWLKRTPFHVHPEKRTAATRSAAR